MAKHKLATRLSKGEKRHRKRMATVATVYEVGRHHRSAQDILGRRPRQQAAPKPCRKRVWASVREDMEKVLDDMLNEARRRDPERRRTWVVLVDGHEEQLRQIARAFQRHGVKVKVVQDFIHVLEYFWEAAWCLHPEGSEDAERWVQDHVLALLCGRVSEAAAASATRRWLLPALRCSGDWDAYLAFHRGRERLRNYPSLHFDNRLAP